MYTRYVYYVLTDRPHTAPHICLLKVLDPGRLVQNWNRANNGVRRAEADVKPWSVDERQGLPHCNKPAISHNGLGTDDAFHEWQHYRRPANALHSVGCLAPA